MELELRIDRLGAQGDGVAQGPEGQGPEGQGPEGPLFVPYALPGERVRVAVEAGQSHGRLLAVLDPSPDRVLPICPHFGICGGCALQHLEEGAYLAWKRDQVGAALASRGLDVSIEPVRSVKLASRRRTTFALARAPSGAVLGYHRRGSHDIFDVEACPVLVPQLEASLPKLKAALAGLAPAKGQARVSVTVSDAGLDVAVEDAPHALGADRCAAMAQASLAQASMAAGVARLTLDGEVVMQRAAPSLTLSGAHIVPPPGAFLQACCAAEQILVELVGEGVGRAKRVADLFAGLGPFTLSLAKGAAVDAFEQDADALAALAAAARATLKLKPVRVHVRDLFRTPLTAKELAAYDAVVLDPPRAGARAQATELAASSVAKIVAVSCNPGTLARDLRILVDGGYRITRVVPVDQFRFSPYIEVVAHLER
jgi:23S rRNA (uracil1939-C5)-methyltransferase